MKKPLPRAAKWFLFGLLLWGIALVLLLASCSTTPSGLHRQQTIYTTSTNIIGDVERVIVPIVPAPWNALLLGFLGAASAGLAAWNTHQQRSIRQLRNGQAASPPHDLPKS